VELFFLTLLMIKIIKPLIISNTTTKIDIFTLSEILVDSIPIPSKILYDVLSPDIRMSNPHEYFNPYAIAINKGLSYPIPMNEKYVN